jgi:hypothetical protein
VPWLHAPFLVTAFAAPVALLLWEFGRRDPRPALVGALLTALFVLGFATIATSAASSPMPHAATIAIPQDLAQASWSRFSATGSSSGSLASWIVRFPTWLGLLLLLSSVVAESRILEHRWTQRRTESTVEVQ